MRECVVRSGAGSWKWLAPVCTGPHQILSGEKHRYGCPACLIPRPNPTLTHYHLVGISLAPLRDAAQKLKLLLCTSNNCPLLVDWEETGKRHGEALEVGLHQFTRDFQLWVPSIWVPMERWVLSKLVLVFAKELLSMESKATNFLEKPQENTEPSWRVPRSKLFWVCSTFIYFM